MIRNVQLKTVDIIALIVWLLPSFMKHDAVCSAVTDGLASQQGIAEGTLLKPQVLGNEPDKSRSRLPSAMPC